MPLYSFLTFEFIQVFKQPTCINRQLPLQLHGEINGSPYVSSLQRQTLQLGYPYYTALARS